MKALGLDLSLNSTGIAFKRKKKIKSGVIQPPKKMKDAMDKIVYTKRELMKWVKKYKPDNVYIEELSFGSRGRGVHSLAKLHGVVLYVLKMKGIRPVMIPPTTMKKHIVGAGNAKKSMVLKALYKRFSIDVDQEDEADAIGILLTGLEIGRK